MSWLHLVLGCSVLLNVCLIIWIVKIKIYLDQVNFRVDAIYDAFTMLCELLKESED